MEDEQVDWSRFVSGIYNYCDRWCERCAFREKCYLWHEEQKLRELHLLRGEDPDDMKVVLEDVSASFRKTAEMLQQMAAEMGIDLDDREPAPASRLHAYQEHPLYQQTMRWSDRLDAFTERMARELPEAAQGMVDAFERGELSDERLALGRLQGVRDDLELLQRYRLLIRAKVARMVGRFGDEELDPIMEEATRGDALGTAKLVDACLTKTAAALWRLGEFEPRWLEEAMLCAGGAESARAEVRAAFSGLQAFRRPGLDEVAG